MSYATLEWKGERTHAGSYGRVIYSPAFYKHLQCIGAFLDKAQLSSLITNAKGGAYNGAAVYAPTGGSDKNALGSTQNNVTPFKVSNQRIDYYFRNNFTTACNLTIYEFVPRMVIPDTIVSAKDAAMVDISEVIGRLILQGIADKIDTAAAGNEVVKLHTVAHASSSTLSFMNDLALSTDISLTPFLTPFDSEMLVEWFKVVKVESFHLRPSDSLHYVSRNDDMFFEDGLEVYLGAETLSYPFSKYIFAQLQGDIGHEGAFAYTEWPKNAGVIDAGVRGRAKGAGPTETALDMYFIKREKYDVFDATLIEPMIYARVETDQNAGDMNDSVIQVITDINELS